MVFTFDYGGAKLPDIMKQRRPPNYVLLACTKLCIQVRQEFDCAPDNKQSVCGHETFVLSHKFVPVRLNCYANDRVRWNKQLFDRTLSIEPLDILLVFVL